MRDCQHDEKSQIRNLSNSAFEHMAVQPFHKMTEEEGLELGTVPVGFCAQPFSRANKENLSELGMHGEEKNKRECQKAWQRQTVQLPICVVVDLTRNMYGHPKQIGVLTLTYFCDNSKCFRSVTSTWSVCTGVSIGLRNRGSNWLCCKCGHTCSRREGSRILSLRHDPEANDVAFVISFQAYPLPAGRVKTLCDTMKLTTNTSDSNLPTEEKETDRCNGATCCVNEGNKCKTVCNGKKPDVVTPPLIRILTINQQRGSNGDVERRVVSVNVPSVSVKWIKNRKKIYVFLQTKGRPASIQNYTLRLHNGAEKMAAQQKILETTLVRRATENMPCACE